MFTFRVSLLLVLWIGSFQILMAQSNYTELLIQWSDHATPAPLIERFERDFQQKIDIEKKVSESLNVWMLRTTAEAPSTLRWLQKQPEIQTAQLNKPTTERGHLNILPNDPLFSQQWQLVNSILPDSDLDAEQAWDIATGGLSPAGDTIVIAVIDGGVAQHPDLVKNLWVNHAETPNDGIDNDQNGYIDDHLGWNIFSQNDDIQGIATSHGTPVAAIIGAKGNNGLGITGINWNVKIMFVAGGGTEADILQAYDYILKARKTYNATNGSKGAFVVAINCSFGIDFGQPNQAPLWCAAFDTLGNAGIISVAATANKPVNVDEVGDLPTACPSDYLIAVTNITQTNLKADNAAWGATHVDLGAYGTEVFTTQALNSYGVRSGTSFATPQVTGAIGLLYAAPCPNLIALAKSAPAAAAAWVKDLVLSGIVPTPSLDSITVTAGRLNLANLLEGYEDQCSPCPAPFALHANAVTVTSTVLEWSEISSFQSVGLRWRKKGEPTWNVQPNVESPYLLNGLESCTIYEFSVSAQCSGGLASGQSPVMEFKTDGCCQVPSGVQIAFPYDTGFGVYWTPLIAANGYHLRIRPSGVSSDWTLLAVNAPPASFQNLQTCQTYEVQIQTLCGTGNTVYSPSYFFSTTGCGACLDAAYCSTGSEHADEEWIESIQIGDDWLHYSGNMGAGYQNFAGSPDVPPLVLIPGTQVPVTITPGFSGLAFSEYHRIFIDFNGDGDFTDNDELAFDPGFAHDGPVSGFIKVPLNMTNALMRMRVMMKFKNNNSMPPEPCEMLAWGQVEDYCVGNIPNVSTTITPSEISKLKITPQPASDLVAIKWENFTPPVFSLKAFNVMGQEVPISTQFIDNQTTNIDISKWPVGIYHFVAIAGERTAHTWCVVQR
jgi:serine protease